MLVPVIHIGSSSVEGGAVAGGELHGGFDTLINGIKVGLGFFNGGEAIAAVPAVHIKSSTEVVGNYLPLGSVEGLSFDARVHNLNR